MRATTLGCLVVFWLAASPPAARAQIVFEFDLAGTPKTDFDIAGVGGTVDVQVYLKETNGSVLTTQKLFGAGVQITINSPAGVAAVLSTSDITPNAAFNDAGALDRMVTASSAKLREATDGSTLVGPDGMNRILFGTFRFTGQAEGSVTITAGRYAPSPQDYIITGQGNALDDLVGTSNATIRVSATSVPEPSSLILTGLAGVVSLAVGARRARRRKVTLPS